MTQELQEANALLHRMTQTKHAVCSSSGQASKIISEAQETIRRLMVRIEELQEPPDDLDELLYLAQEAMADMGADMLADLCRAADGFH
ncbi:MAG: hypothetical protein F4Z95_11010 [Gammaproteobacteria bacterium]|nr:hypothetical protein [Gammaproteobacteria bacterium]MDE0455034.1 hypothetical protein [Gammaproteobacteria bacterium]MXW21324.1 hypothetical protein [Gammaproteobacteria bacterium]